MCLLCRSTLAGAQIGECALTTQRKMIRIRRPPPIRYSPSRSTRKSGIANCLLDDCLPGRLFAWELSSQFNCMFPCFFTSIVVAHVPCLCVTVCCSHLFKLYFVTIFCFYLFNSVFWDYFPCHGMWFFMEKHYAVILLRKLNGFETPLSPSLLLSVGANKSNEKMVGGVEVCE